MNPFEKIFNYQILSRLEESGTFIITAHERGWLKMMLQHPASAHAFAPETLRKLNAVLEQDQSLETDGLLHKAASKERHVYHPNVRLLRQAITNKAILRLSYLMKNGRTSTMQDGFPYKLEYSMVKREWYLLWYHINNRMLMSTRLEKIMEVSEQACPVEDYEQLTAVVHALMNNRGMSADILVVPAYNGELSRILYAFSCFEKEVTYAPEENEYMIRLYFNSSDSEFVLSKTRFLGKRVRILEGEQLRRRMLESATKSLERYAEPHN
ncbi:WYL domain-containing protein [Paenibacillus sp. LHD-38]|uniref:WYL domain-containing protein n=1 Tax=Paenibacillus sp. LHD-38 TaxID=3072143 RepID=UPI00280EF5C5|nr:WYL domain-containing protein [Paenibacillus sp. LHD-38]MDQ8738961.1 WYL domain-containing protein [Paenibacillus sp. LHD-38]